MVKKTGKRWNDGGRYDIVFFAKIIEKYETHF